MKVLSLFDGMSCGYIALKVARMPITEYHTFENDKYAIQASKIVTGDINVVRHGEINLFTDFSQFKGFDLIIGGSPCQGFSFAGKQLNFSDPRSQLFFEFVRAIREAKPKYFLLENVKMKKEYLDIISKHLDVKPVFINSALVSAQNRQRFYWCNWKVEQPKDKGLLLKDIIETGDVDREKSLVSEARKREADNFRTLDSKSKPLLASMWKGSQSNGMTNITDGFTWRKLTPRECFRLQTIPEDIINKLLASKISNTQLYKMAGNGWTVDVIAHIFDNLINPF